MTIKQKARVVGRHIREAAREFDATVNRKRIGGKLYTYYGRDRTQKEAKEYAHRLKEKGLETRILYDKSTYLLGLPNRRRWMTFARKPSK